MKFIVEVEVEAKEQNGLDVDAWMVTEAMSATIPVTRRVFGFSDGERDVRFVPRVLRSRRVEEGGVS